MKPHTKKLPDTSNELQIYRYGNGIKLVRPDVVEKVKSHYFYNTGHTVETAFQLPMNLGFLDTECDVQNINEASAKILGFTSVQSAIGKNIFDVLIRKSAQFATHNNKEVMHSNKTSILEECITCKNDVSIHRLQIRTPWYNNENKIIGVFGGNIVLGKQSLSEGLTHFMQLGLLTPSLAKNLPINNMNLSKRETEIVHYTIQGKSAKMIASILEISPRTVEQHLENIKMKMNVSSKAALIEKAIDQIN